MKLSELLRGVAVLEQTAPEELEITGVSYDSRTTEPGNLFVAVSGYATDGHRFIPMAMAKGAAAVLCERELPEKVPGIRVEDARKTLAYLGCNWYGHPAASMRMIGVTGTNGKTSVTVLLKHLLERAVGAKVGLIGTIRNMIGEESLPTERTTPESFELQGLLARMRDAGCTHVVMEVSSHALELHRVAGIRYACAAFTNLTEDHLDFHHTMQAYAAAKAKLFSMSDRGVFTLDDPYAPVMMAGAEHYTVSARQPADLMAQQVEFGSDHVRMILAEGAQRVPLRIGIPGRFTVSNVLTTVGIARQLGIPLETAAAALSDATGVKGRIEVVPTPGKDYTVLIDYAHTPDGLENVLCSVRDFCKGRLIAVFGCGGDRDRAKRPIMGEIAARYADLVIVTSDNPRTEQPMEIIHDILQGMQGTQTPFTVVENRRQAIRQAMKLAQKEDIILLAGKGHETYQIIGTEKTHLDEREEVAAALCEN